MRTHRLQPRLGTPEIARRYNERGVEGLGDRRHANPGARRRALLDEEGQAELREALCGPPPGGGMWSGPKVARWIAQRNGLDKVHVQRGFVERCLELLDQPEAIRELTNYYWWPQAA